MDLAMWPGFISNSFIRLSIARYNVGNVGPRTGVKRSPFVKGIVNGIVVASTGHYLQDTNGSTMMNLGKKLLFWYPG